MSERYVYDFGVDGNHMFGHDINRDGSMGRKVGFLAVGMCNIPFGETVEITRDANGSTQSVKLVRTGKELFDRQDYDRRQREWIEQRKKELRGVAPPPTENTGVPK